MSKTTQYLLVSLPSSITPSGHKDDALEAIRKVVTPDHGTVSPFAIPEFKIGTLDALVSQADELTKLNGLCEGIVGKVGDGLGNILDGDEAKVSQQKMVNDSEFIITEEARGLGGANSVGRTGGAVSEELLLE
jgi:V-type H+-transporting ATPase subunit C